MISNNIEKKNILMITGDFVEDYEAIVPFQALQIFGHEVHVVCPDKKKGDKIHTAIHELEEGIQTYTEKPGHKFELNYSFSSVNENDYDGLVIPGGRAPEYLRLNKRVIEITTHFIEKNKPIACICHGIQILAACEGMKGRNLTCYPGVANDVKLSGANYKELGFEEALVDGNIVTAVIYSAHPEWLKKFLHLLGTFK